MILLSFETSLRGLGSRAFKDPLKTQGGPSKRPARADLTPKASTTFLQERMPLTFASTGESGRHWQYSGEEGCLKNGNLHEREPISQCLLRAKCLEEFFVSVTSFNSQNK